MTSTPRICNFWYFSLACHIRNIVNVVVVILCFMSSILAFQILVIRIGLFDFHRLLLYTHLWFAGKFNKAILQEHMSRMPISIKDRVWLISIGSIEPLFIKCLKKNIERSVVEHKQPRLNCMVDGVYVQNMYWSVDCYRQRDFIASSWYISSQFRYKCMNAIHTRKRKRNEVEAKP